MIFVATALSLTIGIVLGMLGGGGGILTMPMLVYVLGMEPKSAIASSLFVVGTTSVIGAATHAREGNVRGKVGLVFGAGAMAGAFSAGNLARHVPSGVLMVVFAIALVATATAMFRGRGGDDGEARPLKPLRTALLGVLVGAFSGLVGAGGGFLIVPVLVFFGGLGMRHAVGTSLFVIALQSLAGFAGHATHAALDLRVLAVITVATTIGALGGIALGKRVSPARLRRGFAWLVVFVGVLVFVKQLSPALAAGASALTLLAVFLASRPRRAASS